MAETNLPPRPLRVAPAARGHPLFWRIAGAIIVVFAVLHIAGYWMYGHDRLLQNAQTFATSVAARAATLDTVLTEHPELLDALQSQQLQLGYADAPIAPKSRHDWPHTEEIVDAVHTELATLGYDPNDIRVWFTTGRGGPRLWLALPAKRGGFFNVRAEASNTALRRSSPASWSMSFLALLLVAALLYVTRRITAPMGRFADAAEHLGTTLTADPLPEGKGSREVRRASDAFNAMQARLLALLDERAQMLAGVSHDLRTLCTRLHLRIEDMADGEQRDKAVREIDHMTSILDQALAFARDEGSEEAFAAIDVSSLLQSVTDELADKDHEATFTGPDRLIIDAQPLAAARLFRNLVDNAVKYGGAAEVRLSNTGVVIADPGPGFSADDVTEALRPYRRLEAYRPQDTPGSGLGLAIANNICQRHGWRLDFSQVSGGFEVRVSFAD